MASLRARLVVALLALSALALLVLGAITYTTQRNFLYDRVDEQTRQAVPAVAHALSDQGIGPPIGDGDRDHGGFGAAGGGGGPLFGLPPGVYGERVSASGQVLGSVVISYQQVSEHPAIPAHLQPGRYVTVGSRGGDDARYRVLASPDPSGAGLTIVAVPVHDADAVLHRLLLVEALVIAGVLALLGIVAWFVVRVGLLPLDRMGHTAGAIAAGDL
jgi:two-component system OmpR family sensor kinase